MNDVLSHEIDRTLQNLLLVLVLIVGVGFVAVGLARIFGMDEVAPCPTEDSCNCKWDAQVQGNGEGRSFICIGDENKYTIEFVK